MPRYRLFQRKGVYYLDFRHRGRRYRPTLDTGDRAEAERLAEIAIRTVVELGQVVGFVSLREALETTADEKPNAQTSAMYRAKLRKILELLDGESNLLELEREDVDRYIADRRELGTKDHTIHKELTLIRQAFRRYHPAAANPVPPFSARYQPRKRFLTVAEAGKLLAAASRSSRRVWLYLALFAGAEPAAIARVTWRDVDDALGTLRVPGTKTETRDRIVPIGEELAAFFATCDRRGPLVPTWRNRHRDLKIWCQRAKIDHCTMIDLRRTFGSWLKQAGVDSKRVADLMGHTSTIMVDRVYGQLNADAYREAVSHLPRLPRLVSI